MLDLSHLQIDRLIVHHINARAGDKTLVPPTLGAGLVEMPRSGIDMFTKRMATALGHQSHGVLAQFADVSQSSFFHEAALLMHGDNERFIEVSGRTADRLTKAQLSKGLPASKLLVVSGKTSKAQRPFSPVIKAELQDALAEKSVKNKTVIDHLTDIFLTESQRLYKIGFVQQTVGGPVSPSATAFKSDNYVVHLFDHLMTGTESRHAAMYFYAGFLGADVASSDRRLTQDFYERTMQFIHSQGLSPASRIDVIEALRAELRSNEQTIAVGAFAKKHLHAVLQPKYVAAMQKHGFPTHAITKNVEYIKSRLKRRQKMVFSTGVMVTTPPDRLDLVKIATSADGTTQLTITGTLESTE